MNYLKTTKLLCAAIIAVSVTVSCQDSTDELIESNLSVVEALGEPIDGAYIIVLNDEYTGKAASKGLNYDMQKQQKLNQLPEMFEGIGLTKGQIDHTFSYALDGFSAQLSKEQVSALLKDPRVKRIEQDYMISLAKPDRPGNGGGSDPAQETPWGIDRVGGAIDGTGKTAWIIDSGIDSDHNDLNVDAARSYSFVTKGKYSIEDGNGHGTHVAGTVAAIDNNIGVIGVAPNATVVGLRVLDNRGSGQFSWTIAALDYVAANGQSGDAVNMSLGPQSRYTDSAVDNATINVASLGIKVAIAAGNSSDDANFYSPARAAHPNIYTVSAIDINDNFASFSNYGSVVEYAAPGVGVKSTYSNGGYATLNGTSMASPHVCGLLLLGNISTNGFANGDPDGNPDPIAHN